ncbi:Gfo/Idh/MocA family protein [Microlunatus soli]|uniref:Predicted dehydrogenase n=1 Tax=Microlunatus soli TaxID=630515 RepID=A0A1H1PSU2_9ACTN|nr:Gfo/Idh/MocA family oxidoreductase [Microlunatus soli]SDS14258.1 Predicted dehydrogenase [Microlunatus soli]
MHDISYQFEYTDRLTAAFIGAGGHSFRNIYPALHYAPVDLVAVCDLDQDRAAQYARSFGAARSYSDHHQLLTAEHSDVVFIVTAYDDDGQVQATRLAADCLRAGSHVWMEKPTASTRDQVRELERLSASTGRLVMTGLKKIFTPAIQKAKSIMESDDFGPVSSISVRYPQSLPAEADRRDGVIMRGFLDHIYHPGAVLSYLGGPVTRLSYEWEPTSGGSISSLLFASGVIGSLHLTAGQATNAPLEHVEIVGHGANLVIDNGVRLTYYRRGAELGYGRSGSYIVPDEVAPLTWEPEFSLGQLYNKNLFYLGYVPEILHFCAAVRGEQDLTLGTLHQVDQIMALYEAYQQLPAGVVGRLDRTTAGQATAGQATEGAA